MVKNPKQSKTSALGLDSKMSLRDSKHDEDDLSEISIYSNQAIMPLFNAF